jgi:hypothetical protein
VLGRRRCSPPRAFRTIQDLLSTYRAGSVIVSILRTRFKSEGDIRCQLAGHVVERPRRGPLFARNVAVEALARSRNTNEWKSWNVIIGGVQWGNTAIRFVAALPSWASLPQRSLTRSSFVVDRLNSNGFAKLVQDVNRLIVQFLRLGDICGEQPSRGQGA